jgi:hypothetical protein
MANGDSAAEDGMDVVAGTADRRQGYDEINKTRDYIAGRLKKDFSNISGGYVPISAGGTGATTAADARTALGITASTVPRVAGGTAESGITDAWNRAGQAQADATYARTGVDTCFSGQLSPDVYSRTVGGNVVYVTSGGLLGHLPSTRTVKKNIRDADLDPAAIRSVLIRSYQYKAAVELGDDRHIGLIAEELESAGFGWLVGYDTDGKPMTVHYEWVGLIALALAQDDADRLDAFSARLAKLEAAQ